MDGRRKGEGRGEGGEPGILENAMNNDRRDAWCVSRRHVVGSTKVIQRGTPPGSAPADQLVVPAGVEETQDGRQRLMPLRGAIDDTRTLGRVVDRDGMAAKRSNRGQAFHKEVSKGASVRASRIHPPRVPSEDGGFDVPPVGKCGGGMWR